MPAGATAVPASPESCISAFSRADGDRVKRAKNPGGSVAPLATALSSPVAIAKSLAGAEDGSRAVKSGNPVGPRGGPPPPPPPPPAAIRLHNVIVLASSVTEPVCAQRAPQVTVALGSSVMLVSARMSPENDVVEPSVAELPIRQNTLPPCAPLISVTFEALAVVRVLPMLMTKIALELPRPLSVRLPVN